jgi:bla regulator protein blaR1
LRPCLSLGVEIDAPFANHLWQSTLFAAIAGLLTIALKKNRAGTRYSIWLIASVKFLIPFSLLVAIGDHLARTQSFAPPAVEIFTVMQAVSEPFTAVKIASTRVPTATGVRTFVARNLPVALFLIWVAGLLSVLSYWWFRMRRMTAAARDAEWLQEGREISGLSRAQGAVGVRRPIRVALSNSALEPGVLGIRHPVLILPVQNASIFAALEQRLGLKIEEQEAPIEVVVVDHAAKPAEVTSRANVSRLPR